MVKILIFILIIAGLGWISLVVMRKLFPGPAPALMGPLFDSWLRKKIQSPTNVIKWSGLKKGMKVLEIGCGSGAFTLKAAQTVGVKGQIWALDIQAGMLKQLERKLARLEEKERKRVKLIKGRAEDLPWGGNFFDLVFMVTVFGEIADKQKCLREIRRVLKPGGILAVTELWLDPDYQFKTTIINWAKRAGFKVDQVWSNFFSYTIRLRKS